jgi:hypothetical protein
MIFRRVGKEQTGVSAPRESTVGQTFLSVPTEDERRIRSGVSSQVVIASGGWGFRPNVTPSLASELFRWQLVPVTIQADVVERLACGDVEQIAVGPSTEPDVGWDFGRDVGQLLPLG